MEMYPETRGMGGRGARGARGGAPAAPPAAAAQPIERLHLNEDEPTPLHAKNFVDCVRARRDPSPNIETAARATAISLLANVAFWTGRKLTWDAKTWSFPGDADANKHLFRTYRKPWDLVKFT